jgi:ABC-type Mn2+/Zn2+ transport system ATPase subunit
MALVCRVGRTVPIRKPNPAVTAEDLVLAYRDDPALDRSSFAIDTGSVTSLVGPNGSGKSTLLRALAGLLRPLRGRLAVAAARRRGGVAIVLQATDVDRTLPITVRETVTLGRYALRGPFRPHTRDDRAMVDRAMARLGVDDLAGTQLRELSGGQRQRVFVAQGLAQDADLLLLDEPLTGLDLVSREHITEAITDEHEAGRTVVVSTHDLAEAARADQVLLLAGRVVAEGPPERILSPEHLAEAYGGHLLDLGAFAIDDPHHDHH